MRYRSREAVGATLGTVVIFWFILVATGATLGAHHEGVSTAEQAAQALAPIAGRYASDVFGVGLLVSALVASPVLLATAGNVVAVQLRASRALPARPHREPVFAAAMGAAIVFALAVVVGLRLPVVRLLVIASVVGGIATPLGLTALMMLSRDRRTPGTRVVGTRLSVAGWAVTALITVLSALYLIAQLRG